MSEANYQTVLRLLQDLHAENTELKNRVLQLEQTQGPITIQAPPSPPQAALDFVQTTLRDTMTTQRALRQELTHVRNELYKWKDRAIEAEAYIDQNHLGQLYRSRCRGNLSGISSGCCQDRESRPCAEQGSNDREIPGSAPGCGGTPSLGLGGAGGKPESPTTFGDWLVDKIAKEDELSR